MNPLNRSSACIVPTERIQATLYRYWARGYSIRYVHLNNDDTASIGAVKEIAKRNFT